MVMLFYLIFFFFFFLPTSYPYQNWWNCKSRFVFGGCGFIIIHADVLTKITFLHVRYFKSAFDIFTLKLLVGTGLFYSGLLQSFSAYVSGGFENAVWPSGRRAIIFVGHNFVRGQGQHWSSFTALEWHATEDVYIDFQAVGTWLSWRSVACLPQVQPKVNNLQLRCCPIFQICMHLAATTEGIQYWYWTFVTCNFG